MTAHELGQGVQDDVSAVFDRLAQVWGCHGVVDDQRYASFFGHC